LAGAHSKGGASAYENPLVLWDISGEVLRLVAQDKNSFGGGVITAVGFCNNGQNLVCGTSEGGLQHWEQKAPTTGAPRSSRP
jgi:hypothetical protein